MYKYKASKFLFDRLVWSCHVPCNTSHAWTPRPGHVKEKKRINGPTGHGVSISWDLVIWVTTRDTAGWFSGVRRAWSPVEIGTSHLNSTLYLIERHALWTDWSNPTRLPIYTQPIDRQRTTHARRREPIRTNTRKGFSLNTNHAQTRRSSVWIAATQRAIAGRRTSHRSIRSSSQLTSIDYSRGVSMTDVPSHAKLFSIGKYSRQIMTS